MKKCAALTLILIILTVLAMSSCDGNKNNSDSLSTETSAEGADGGFAGEQTTEITGDSLPDDLDFNQSEVTLFAFEEKKFYAEEETGDVVEDALYLRKISVEDRLNVKINIISSGPWNEYGKALTAMRSSILADDHAYQFIAGYGAYIPTLAAEGLIMDLYKVPYIDLKKPWWAQNITNELTVGNKLYFATGDIGLAAIAKSFVILFNKTVQKEYGIEDIYQTVLDGKWTIDHMADLAKTISKDLNGDGVMDAKDMYGAAFTPYNIMDAFLQSSNIRMTKMNEDGFPVFEMEYEKVDNIINKLYNLMYENTGVYPFKAEGEDVNTMFSMFKKDSLLFCPAWIEQFIGRLRDMESDYGIVPYPKYDEAQKEYYTGIQNGMTLMCVPVNCDKTEEAGAVMEAMASEGYFNVTPKYFEVAMKLKYSRDEDSSRMLDIIRGGAYMPFACIYNQNIGNPWDVARTLISGRSNNFASWYETNETKISLATDDFVNAMRENN